MDVLVVAVVVVLLAAGVRRAVHARRAGLEEDRRWYTEDQIWWARLHSAPADAPPSRTVPH